MEQKIRTYGMMPTIASERKITEIQKLTYNTDTRRVCGGQKNGKRPYINFMNAQYRNDLLASSDIYLGKELTLLINPDDVSCIEAFTEDGVSLGILRANGEKGARAHSIKNRKAINRYAKQNKLDNRSFSTPVTAYEQELERRAPYSKRDRTRADILRREEGKLTLLEQDRIAKENPAPVMDINKAKRNDKSLPALEEIQNMTAEEIWKYIKRAK